MSRCQGRPAGRPAGTGAKRRPLTTTGIIIKHNKKRPPARAGLQATRAPQSAAHTRLFVRTDLCCGPQGVGTPWWQTFVQIRPATTRATGPRANEIWDVGEVEQIATGVLGHDHKSGAPPRSGTRES